MGNLLKIWWPGTELNRRRQPFQGCALPLSYLATFAHSLSAGDLRAVAGRGLMRSRLSRAIRILEPIEQMRL